MRHFPVLKRLQRVRQNMPCQFTLMWKSLAAVRTRIDWNNTIGTNTAILFTRRRRREWHTDKSTTTRSFTTMFRRRFLQPNKKEKPSTSLSNYFFSVFVREAILFKVLYFIRLLSQKFIFSIMAEIFGIGEKKRKTREKNFRKMVEKLSQFFLLIKN